MSASNKMPPDGEKKKKKSKLEKIHELQEAKKGLKEENEELRRQLDAARRGKSPASTGPAVPRYKEGKAGKGKEEKLMEAMRTLKRVIVKQEKSLYALRQKAEERRQQIANRDEQIEALKNEVAKLKHAQEERRVADSDDPDTLRAKVDDLQLSCSEQENRNKVLSARLHESEERSKNLQKQLDSARSLIQRSPSHRSVRSGETSLSDADVARLRKELANNIERIVLLEFDLEMCKDELHELRQGRISTGDEFPSPDGQNNDAIGFEESFYSDDEEDDDEDDDHDNDWR